MPIDAEMFYREGGPADLPQLRQLAIESWYRFEAGLLPENWTLLWNTIRNAQTYETLLACSKCLVCETGEGRIVGMVFLVPKGNPTALYLSGWSVVRFLTVHPDFEGLGIGRKLMADCIMQAKRNGEAVMALHTSEMMNNARRLYENLGFRIIREIEPRFGKRYWLYKLEL
ncbi:GNAT family N-acetyltransferase [Niabella sp. CC-SYL272]|uniref:GNAT family N-acetyltransferase n=1 Tax=Niabella agricola TaxID=2891571 RepID=UPI001F3849DC|nr:GNAT family N-acetyltransferase [Niabella agricola]MCF3109742.1 GNAT family N-acetyltransferase [Niabella agricola]